MPAASDRSTTPQPDGGFLRARREAALILASWAACLLWTIVYSHLFGYKTGPVSLVFGIPSWVFFGILVPWVAATVFSVWFSLRWMKGGEDG